jgi:hypothetical protein
VTCVGEVKNAYRILIGISLEKQAFGRPWRRLVLEK